ncbi:FtsQ-type POTRA domain-containing protein [Nocardia higoensis]|uniref:FtsQ-type POTRA domain-containing protein n=1 Tax=Nocardia higoensis TaxID=228599 RepID=A0ABS0DFM0_9NOCA|nr:FtsQ-type POTRA domain-containing protein [Nocardia higoensis]
MRAAGELLGPGGLRRVRWWALLGVIVLTVLLSVAWFTPALSVRTIEIDGLSTVSEERVREQLDIPDGLSLMRIDTVAMAERVASIAEVRSARVERVYPSTVRVTVDERRAVLWFDAPEGAHLVDRDAVEFAIAAPPIGVPQLVTDHPGGSDPVTRAAVTVANAIPPALNIQVDQVLARSISDISLKLTDGRTVVWGAADDAERKAAVVLPLLTREGTVFDVSSPNLVTVK